MGGRNRHLTPPHSTYTERYIVLLEVCVSIETPRPFISLEPLSGRQYDRGSYTRSDTDLVNPGNFKTTFYLLCSVST